MKKVLFAAQLILIGLMLSACTAADASFVNKANAVNSDIQALRIPLAELTQDVTFYDYDSDGIAMQVIARLQDDGTPRLAYNTCQVCAGSPRAYFEVQNDLLVCQNCGNMFRLDVIGMEGTGCMPIALTEFTVNGDDVEIANETLDAMRGEFVNWKVGL